jgi:HAD superfamily hydrolase (TIGR01490 family)
MSAREKVGAFFDLDGTLLPAPSLEWRFIGYLLAREEIGSGHVTTWLAHCARTILRSPHAAVESNKFYLQGLPESLAADWANTFGGNSLPFFAQGSERIDWHLALHHRVFIVSGTLAPLARVLPRHLSGSVEIRATELEVSRGRWTGRLAGDHLSGEAKAQAVRELAGRYGIDLNRSYAYGNRIRDLAMLDAVGHAFAVNPSSRLERIAEVQRWQILNWRRGERDAGGVHSQALAPKEAR